MTPEGFEVRPIGVVRSSIERRGDGPKQGREGAPEAWIDVEPDVLEAIDGTPVVDIKPVLDGSLDA